MGFRGKCFVIMGYGIKTDHSTGRELNLDKTYKNIIKPAVKKANLECIRADEIKHSGTIDLPMYEHLLEADVVIADLSTYNVNAFYELGVRHALRPRTTIAIAESELQAPFDMSHTVLHRYEHLGKDIGCDEAERFKKELVDTINEILVTEKTDSPVYTYLKDLRPPKFDSRLPLDTEENEEKEESLGSIIESASNSLDKDDFISAKSLLEYARSIDSYDSYIIQKLALATYKSKSPTHVKALKEALSILDILKPDKTTDPETLGLCGAIYKRLWEEEKNTEDLSKAIKFYEKGFYIKNDYYNGINFAYLLNVRGNMSDDHDESIADYIVANRIRKSVIDICKDLYNNSCFEDRSDKYWIVATLEEAYFALNLKEEYDNSRNISGELCKENWERETTTDQISKLKLLIESSPLKR